MSEVLKNNQESDLDPDKFVTVEGVNFFGEKGPKVSLEDIENLKSTIDNEAYILKHFSELPPEEYNRLLDQEVYLYGKKIKIDETFINNQFKVIGSKFNPKIEAVSSPQKVLALVEKYLPKTIKEKEPNWIIRGPFKDCLVSLEIDEQIKKAEGISQSQKIGTANLIEITPDIKSKVVQQERGKNNKYLVNTIKGIPMPETDKIIVALRWFNDKEFPKFNSIHSGIIAPPPPNPDEQSSAEIAAYNEWWDKHAFIVQED